MNNYEFFNPHPQGKFVADCVKRALVKATGESYHDIQLQLNRIKRKLNQKKYNYDPVWQAFIQLKYNAKKVSFPAKKGCSRMTVEKLASSCKPTDVFICSCAHHLVCIKDNKYWDTWNSGERCVYCAWQIS